MSKIPITAILFSVVLLFCPVCQAEEKLMRLGMIGLDTSHVIAFTQIINNPKNNYGCKVVAGFSGGSHDMPASANRVEKFTEKLRTQFGLEIVDTIEELCRKVDGVLLESVDGRPHLKQVRPVIAAKKPVFIDKPVAASLADVIEIFRLARENNVPCWSSSSFRYGEGIVGVQDNKEIGKVKSCDVFGSSSWTEHHPDLYLYGIRPVPVRDTSGDSAVCGHGNGLREGQPVPDSKRRYGCRDLEGRSNRDFQRPSRRQKRSPCFDLWYQRCDQRQIRRLQTARGRNHQVL
jgi:hypothetical protein